MLAVVSAFCLNSCDADAERTEYGAQDKTSVSTLGDELKRSLEKTNEASSPLSFRNGQMSCEIDRIDLAWALTLPDCTFGSETYAATEAHVLLVIQGQVQNMGNEPAHFQIPVFRTTKGRQYNEVDSIHYKAFQSNLFAATLNPESYHRFICFYRVPLNEVMDGYLVFEKKLINLNDDLETVIKLPVNVNQKIERNLVIPNVTDF